MLAADVPPAIVRGHLGRPFVDYYLGVKTKADGSFDHWIHLPCNGKCHVVKARSATLRTLAPNGTYVYRQTIVRPKPVTSVFVG
jgi:hypothetical protein